MRHSIASSQQPLERSAAPGADQRRWVRSTPVEQVRSTPVEQRSTPDPLRSSPGQARSPHSPGPAGAARFSGTAGTTARAATHGDADATRKRTPGSSPVGTEPDAAHESGFGGEVDYSQLRPNQRGSSVPETTKASEGRHRQSAGRTLFTWTKELLIVVVGALIVSAVLRAFVFEPFTIPSGSMENTFAIQDKVVAQKVTDFHRGDAIVFKDPDNWLPANHYEEPSAPARALMFIGVLPNTSDRFLTKRVIGMPGDKVAYSNEVGKVTVNGTPLAEDSYLYSDANGTVKPSNYEFEVTVPADHVFVMGDHRNASADSRCHLNETVSGKQEGETAFVPLDHIVGSVKFIAAPFSRAKVLDTPTTFGAVPAPLEPAPQHAQIEANISC